MLYSIPIKIFRWYVSFFQNEAFWRLNMLKILKNMILSIFHFKLKKTFLELFFNLRKCKKHDFDLISNSTKLKKRVFECFSFLIRKSHFQCWGDWEILLASMSPNSDTFELIHEFLDSITGVYTPVNRCKNNSGIIHTYIATLQLN